MVIWIATSVVMALYWCFEFQNENPRLTKPHSHERDDTAVGVAKVKAAMKDHTRVSRERPVQIFASHVASVPDNIRADLGNKESVKCNIRNSQWSFLPKDPATLQDLTIDGQWSQTSREEAFLIHDTGQDSQNRVIVFASDMRLRHLATIDTWMEPSRKHLDCLNKSTSSVSSWEKVQLHVPTH